MGQHDARMRILARRARFVTSALLAVSGCAAPAQPSAAPSPSPPAGSAAPKAAGLAAAGGARPSARAGALGGGHGGGVETSDAGTDAAPKLVAMICLSIDILESVRFAAGSARIPPRDYAVLDEVVKVAHDYPDVRIELQGHTSGGEDRHGARLDVERAEAVRQYLIDHGLDASRLCVRGYGEERPLAPNLREEDRAKNRRVEFFRLEPDTPCSP